MSRPGLAAELRARRDVLPAQQEPHEVLGGRGFDAAAPRAARVRVHPRQQAARHPLGVGRSWSGSDPAARSRSVRGTRARRARARSVKPWSATSEVVDGGDAADLEVAAQHRTRSRLRRRRRRGPRRRRARWCTTADRHRCCEHRRARPRAASSSNSACHSARGRTTTSDDRRSWRSSADAGSGVISPCTCSMAAGSSAPIDAEVDREPASQRDRVGAPVLQLFVVEERVGPGGEDLVRQHRRLGGVGEVHGDRARLPSARAARGCRRRRAPRAACR